MQEESTKDIVTGKRGFAQLNLIAVAAVIFVVAGIVTAFGSKITSDIASELTGQAADNANNATLGIGRLAKYLPLLGLVVAAAIIISVVVNSFKTG